jgi:hypothetical protein
MTNIVGECRYAGIRDCRDRTLCLVATLLECSPKLSRSRIALHVPCLRGPYTRLHSIVSFGGMTPIPFTLALAELRARLRFFRRKF